MRLHVADYHILAPRLATVRFLQHPKGLTDARREAQHDLVAAPARRPGPDRGDRIQTFHLTTFQATDFQPLLRCQAPRCRGLTSFHEPYSHDARAPPGPAPGSTATR